MIRDLMALKRSKCVKIKSLKNLTYFRKHKHEKNCFILSYINKIKYCFIAKNTEVAYNEYNSIKYNQNIYPINSIRSTFL